MGSSRHFPFGSYLRYLITPVTRSHRVKRPGPISGGYALGGSVLLPKVRGIELSFLGRFFSADPL